MRAAVLAGAILLVTAAAAEADKRIEAATPNRYTAPSVTIDQGEPLTFGNTDVTARHDVTAGDPDPDGRPLFSTPIIPGGREVPVEGAQYLTTGSYRFFCSVHPFMTGTLNVTSLGTPVPRPGDTTAPELGVNLRRGRLSSVRRKGRLAAVVSVNETASVALTATTRVRGRTLTLAAAEIRELAPGARTMALRLRPAARRALGRRRSVVVTIAARAIDTAGNEAAARRSRAFRD